MKPIKTLYCCCCGQLTKGRQWWNQDTGYGLCNRCIPWKKKDYDCSEMERTYGKEGIHYNLPEKKRVQ